jgi:hypothetical protein
MILPTSRADDLPERSARWSGWPVGHRRVLGTASRGGDVWWAPSSDRLTFIEDGHAVVVNPNGTERLELPNANSVAWSQDGAWLASVRDELLAPRRGSQPPMRWASIWRVRGEGTDVHLVLDGGAPSPDGTRIQFWIVPWISGSFMAGGVPLEAIPVAGGPRIPIAPKMLVYPDFLAWSPNGLRLALVQGGPRST